MKVRYLLFAIVGLAGISIVGVAVYINVHRESAAPAPVTDDLKRGEEERAKVRGDWDHPQPSTGQMQDPFSMGHDDTSHTPAATHP